MKGSQRERSTILTQPSGIKARRKSVVNKRSTTKILSDKDT